MTAVVEPPPVEAELPAPITFVASVPVATLTADLMPDEIVVKRRLAYLKRRLVFVMAVLVALVVLGDTLARQQTNSAESDLSGANNTIATLNDQLTRFGGMLATQGETQAIRTQLDGVMGTDVSWPQLLNGLAGPAPTGVRISSITAQVNDPDAATGATPDPISAVADAAGSLTLTGAAPSWTDVATYVRRLSAVKGFTAVNPSTVSNGVGGPGSSSGASMLSFTITLDLTSAAMSNRYAVATTTTDPSATSGSTADAQTTPSASDTSSGTASSRNAPSQSVSTVVGPAGTTRSTTQHAPSTSSARQHHAHHSRTRHRTTTSGARGPAQNTQEAS